MLDVSEGADIAGAIVTFTDRHSELSGVSSAPPAHGLQLLIGPRSRQFDRMSQYLN
jgi:hypothetical protein